MWLEDNWDHKFLAWKQDTLVCGLINASTSSDFVNPVDDQTFYESIVLLPFNPTAENMAQFLVDVIGPSQLQGTGVQLVSVTIEETAKCSASYEVVK